MFLQSYVFFYYSLLITGSSYFLAPVSSGIFIKKEVLVLSTSLMRHRGFEPRTT